MILYDALAILIFTLTAIRSKSRVAAWCVLAYTASVIFAWSPIFYLISPSYSYIHTLYAIIFALFIPIVTPNFFAALGLALYAGFNLIVSIDYIFYPRIDTIISSNYLAMHMVLVVCLMYLSTRKVDNANGDSDPVINNIIDRLGYLSCSFKRLQRVERPQC